MYRSELEELRLLFWARRFDTVSVRSPLIAQSLTLFVSTYDFWDAPFFYGLNKPGYQIPEY